MKNLMNKFFKKKKSTEIKEVSGVSFSVDGSHEYCATIVRLGEILPIEGANTVAKTLVNGREIVISNTSKEGDIMIYVSNECQLNNDFMRINNLYENIELNSNFDEVNKWLEQNTDASEDEVKEYMHQHRGYFDKRARVRMKKLCGTVSMGFLFGVDLLKNWCPMLDYDFEANVGSDFDTVNCELFVKAYVPPVKGEHHTGKTGNRRDKKLKKYNRMIPGQFSFHYDTQQFERSITRFNPDDIVTISVKLHGTSMITGNILVKEPKFGGLYNKIFLYLPKFLQFTKSNYDVVCSSRSVIINSSINPNKGVGFASGMVQKTIKAYADVIGEFIPKDITVYGEIVGYYDGSNTPIQKIGNAFDYGCNPGKNQLMIYRVTQNQSDGPRLEWDVEDVLDFTVKLKEKLVNSGNSDFADRIRPIDIVYHGKLKDLYPDLDTENHWHENLLERMKNDTEHFGMELNEPFCKNKVYREGVVIRIDGDPVSEAFKLKCLKFLEKEAIAIDKGEVSDNEMMEKYGE